MAKRLQYKQFEPYVSALRRWFAEDNDLVKYVAEGASFVRTHGNIHYLDCRFYLPDRFDEILREEIIEAKKREEAQVVATEDNDYAICLHPLSKHEHTEEMSICCKCPDGVCKCMCMCAICRSACDS